MNQKGFTLIEVLVTIIIVGILASVALPIYTRAIERSRALEAMSNIKAINDAIYMYHADKQRCPERFSQLVSSITLDPTVPNNTLSNKEVYTKFFSFKLNAKNVPYVPGTNNCKGVLAKRRNGGGYKYGIYNPYKAVEGKAFALACTPLSDAGVDTAKSIAICESLGIYNTDITVEQ